MEMLLKGSRPEVLLVWSKYSRLFEVQSARLLARTGVCASVDLDGLIFNFPALRRQGSRQANY